jgi:hypothetical protein
MERIDFNNNDSCTNDKECELRNYKFKNSSKSQWKCKKNKCILTCYEDKHCGTDGLCDNNICKNKNYMPLMKGCLNEDSIDNFNKISDNIENSMANMQNQLKNKIHKLEKTMKSDEKGD